MTNTLNIGENNTEWKTVQERISHKSRNRSYEKINIAQEANNIYNKYSSLQESEDDKYKLYALENEKSYIKEECNIRKEMKKKIQDKDINEMTIDAIDDEIWRFREYKVEDDTIDVST